MDVANVALGSEGKLEVDVIGGKLVIKIIHAHASGSVTVVAEEDLKYFLEILKGKLPSWAQIAVAVAEGALP